MPARDKTAEDQIRRQVDKIVEGIRVQSVAGLRRLYAADVVSFDVEPPLQHVGVEAKMKNWANVFTLFRDVTYEVRDLTLTARRTSRSGTASAGSAAR
jgi:ketosteroid isomerase-like protein